MKIELSNEERALLNGLIAVRLCELGSGLSNCSAIQDKKHQKMAQESVKKEQRQLESLLERVNLIELAIPNKVWGSERSI